MVMSRPETTVGRECRPFADLREFLSEVEKAGQLKQIHGADWNLEIGAITELGASRPRPPVLLFDNIRGYEPGWRVVTNLLSNVETLRERLIYGCPLSLSDADAVKFWKEELKALKPIPPVSVNDGPIRQHIAVGEDVNLLDLPWVQWHEHDGGRYMCSTSSVTRDPETGYVNVGSYRFMLVDRDSMVVHIGSGHHGDVIRQKYWSQGKPCPIAVSLGQDPAVLIAAGTNLSWQEPEYDYAGGLRGAPVEVTPGEITGLPIPATAEVVIEAEMLPPDTGTAIEGPFGEASGYYGGGAHPTSLTKVRSIMWRDNPIILGMPPFHNAGGDVLGSRAIRIWAELDQLGIPGISAINFSWGLCIIGVKQAYPGHPMRAALGALGGTAGYHGRLVIVVDDDVNVYDTDEVLWAIATRCDPGSSIDICRRIWSYRIDPRLEPEKREKGDYTGSVAIIDATRPFHWKDRFPHSTSISPELRQQTDAKWGAVLDA